MKKTKAPEVVLSDSDDLRPEYQFDYQKARPNRFVGRVDPKAVVITLEPDVSQVFTTSESVNKILRVLISAMPKSS